MGKKLKKLIWFMLLFPLIPIMGIPGDGDEDNEGDDEDDADTDDTDTGAGEAGAEGKSFTQAEVDAMITKRLDRAAKSWEKKRTDKAIKAAMSETDKLKQDKLDAESNANIVLEKANQKLLKAEVIVVSNSLKIRDADAAFALMNHDLVNVDDNGKVTGVKEALTKLAKAKPYLVLTVEDGDTKTSKKKAGDDTGDDKGKKSGLDMNSLIRGATGRS